MKENKKYLIVGSASVAGSSAIAAVRKADAHAHIIGTTSRTEAMPEVDETITGIDLSKPKAALQIQDQLKSKVDTLIFCPAFGNVGTPIRDASLRDVEECFQFSVNPFIELAQDLDTSSNIGFSSFYWLDSLKAAYGSMAFAKYAIEKIAVENPERFRIVRAGLFPSKSIRGICIMIQRAIRKDAFEGAAELRQGWKESGLGFPEYFTHYAQSCEKRQLAHYLQNEYSATTSNDMISAIELALSPETAPIINIVGGSRWLQHDLPDVPEFLIENSPAFELASSVSLQNSLVEV